MGSQLSKIKERNGVNYHCPECKKSKKAPNLVGKFVLINDYQFGSISPCKNNAAVFGVSVSLTVS